MNKLPIEKRVQIITLLVEGNSLRSASRIADVSINTVSKLLVDVGRACDKFHNEKVVDIAAKRVQCDEIWSFVYAKKKNVPEGMEDYAGDVWTWVGIDADTKLVISWMIGGKDAESGKVFMEDLAQRITNRIQLTTDGHHAYLEAVDAQFDRFIDYAQLIKIYGKSGDTRQTEKKYSPAECVGTEKKVIAGNPDPKHISTSYVERQNLTMRMHMRRFTRLTNAIALHFVYYNFVKLHKSLRITPAMEAGLTKRFISIEDVVNLTEIK
jgi:IS1 family transposase